MFISFCYWRSFYLICPIWVLSPGPIASFCTFATWIVLLLTWRVLFYKIYVYVSRNGVFTKWTFPGKLRTCCVVVFLKNICPGNIHSGKLTFPGNVLPEKWFSWKVSVNRSGLLFGADVYHHFSTEIRLEPRCVMSLFQYQTPPASDDGFRNCDARKSIWTFVRTVSSRSSTI